MSAAHPAFEPWIVRAARLHPRRAAIEAPDGRLNYQELEFASRWLAGRLAADGLAAGDEVAIHLPAGGAFAVALHACLRAGLVAVPIDGRLPAAQQAQRAAGCVRELDGDPLAEALRQSVPADDGGPPPAPRPLAGSGADAATAAVRLATSGTTGPGTPVALSRGALLWNALGSAAALGQPADERWLSAMPVAHVGGLTVLVRSAIGATAAVLRPAFDPAEQLALLQSGAATITSMVPTMLSRLLAAGLEHPPGLRLVLLGGAPIPASIVARAGAAGIEVASTYGLSEACSQVLTRGRPLFCTRIALRSEVEGRSTTGGDRPSAAAARAASSSSDELLVRGPTLATGAAGPSGWLATGDRGRRLADGSLTVVGRLAETIVTGGENVAPTEVEAALVALDVVADAAVLGVPHPEWGEQLEARVVLSAGCALDEAALRSALREALPPFAIPKRITAVEALPRTPTGKLRRRELR